ncbi:unnamed protein product [Amoebophrya sp. A120]|nr:unnamed protein product [Amoebophrya sp. A120]|eukprot:GSA120T00009154001.1
MPRKSLNKLATIATAAAFLTDGPAVGGALVSGAKNKNAATKTHLWAGREDVESNLMQVDASKNSNRGKSSKGRTTQDTCELELDALRDSHLSTVCEDESLSLVDLLVTLPEGGRWKPCVDDSGKSGPNPYPDFQDGSKRRCPLGVEVQCVSGKKQGKPVQLCEGCGNGYWDGCGDGCHREEHVKLVEGHEIKNVCVSGSAGAAWDGGVCGEGYKRDHPIYNFRTRRCEDAGQPHRQFPKPSWQSWGLR